MLQDSLVIAWASKNKEECLKQSVRDSASRLALYREVASRTLVDYSTKETFQSTRSKFGLLKIEATGTLGLFLSSKLYLIQDDKGAVSKVHHYYIQLASSSSSPFIH